MTVAAARGTSTEAPGRAGSAVTNCFSVDVEGFVESNRQSVHIDDRYINPLRENAEIAHNVEALLALLDETNVRGTFFILGRVGRDLPRLVRMVAERGHEIGSHSFDHLRIFGMSRGEFAAKVRDSKTLLEDVSGTPVYGFRAPDFSITAASLWALDSLREAGFAYDASIWPYGAHDVYGIRGALPTIHRLPNGMLEFPLSTLELWRWRFPFGGGGYFRLYPLLLTEFCMARANRAGRPCMFYIHPYEAGPEVPQIPGLSRLRRIRHYYNCAGGERRLRRILRAFSFAPAVDILRAGGFLEGLT